MSVGKESIKRVSGSKSKKTASESAKPAAKAVAAKAASKPAAGASAKASGKAAVKKTAADTAGKAKKAPVSEEQPVVNTGVMIPMPETVRVMSNLICDIPTYLL
ncbi:MAG: hypothetical protein K6E33_01155 [Lachnospiraceae bacterium]|nr:hypothetical protein [Lachnospiraceae bacterium]